MKDESTLKKIKSFVLNGNVGSVVIALAVLCVVWSLLTPYFLTLANVRNLMVYSAYMGIMASGLTFVFLTGCIDLSQMPMMAMCGMLMAVAYQKGVSGFGLFVIPMIGGLVGGCLNGFIVNQLRITPFIATTGTQLIFRACAYLLTNGVYITVKDSMIRSIGYGSFLGIPIMFYIMVIVLLISWFIMKYTQFGRNLYSCGSSPQAAHLAGINVKRTKALAYIASGVCCGIASVVYTAQTGVALNNAGTGAEMDIIAATVIGGTSMAGGRGSAFSTFLGVVLMSVVANGMGLLGMSPYFQMMLKGIILVLAVFIDIIRDSASKN